MRGELEAYLDALAGHVPRSTVISHKSTLNGFVDYCQPQLITAIAFTPEQAAEYIIVRRADKSEATINGEIDTLANYFAYVHQTSPSIAEAKIRSALANQASTEASRVSAVADADARLEATTSRAVDALVMYLRNSDFGSRRHALVELILATAVGPTLVPAINRGDFRVDDGKVELPIPSTSVVGRLPDCRHIVHLPPEAVSAIETFCEYDRIEGHEALFTTDNGRISPSTIRRTVKNGFESAMQAAAVESGRPLTTSGTVPSTAESVSPETIRQYALEQVEYR